MLLLSREEGEALTTAESDAPTSEELYKNKPFYIRYKLTAASDKHQQLIILYVFSTERYKFFVVIYTSVTFFLPCFLFTE